MLEQHLGFNVKGNDTSVIVLIRAVISPKLAQHAKYLILLDSFNINGENITNKIAAAM